MIKTIKVMLVPNNKQKSKLFQYAGAARFAYNWALSKQEENYKNGLTFISDNELRKEFTILKHSDEFEWLNSISNNVMKQSIKDLCNAYKRYFKLRKQSNYKPYSAKLLAHLQRIGKEPTLYMSKGHPKFKKKRDINRYGFFQDPLKIKFTNTHVKLEGFANSKRINKQKLNYVRLAEHGRIPTNCKYYNPRITFDGINWWISVGVDMDECRYQLNNIGIGIDLGIKDLAICSDSNKYKNINKSKTIKKLEKQKRRLQRSISRSYEKNKKKGKYCKTNNVIKKEKLLLKLNHRLANIRNNYLHQTTIEIVNRKPRFICIEDLNVSGMIKNKHLSKAVQNQGFYEFRRQLEYKCEDKGIQLVIADRFYPSSKICNCCGNVKKDLKLSDRTYKCECGYIEDRDFNASLNLKSYGDGFAS